MTQPDCWTADTPTEALMGAIVTCREHLDAISHSLDLVHDHHDPDEVSWPVAAEFWHLAAQLQQARRFVQHEEE